MASRQEARRGLEEAYVARVLRAKVDRAISDESHGAGYALVLGAPEPVVELEVYPDCPAVVLRSPVFTLECTGVSDVRSRDRRLHFSARSGPRRIGVAVSRSGAVDVRYRDETPQISEWEQGILWSE
jgi:hypothetical protein